MKQPDHINTSESIANGTRSSAGCTTPDDSKNTHTVSASTKNLLDISRNGENAINPYMLLAIDEANKGIEQGDGGPFGTVIVKDGVVVGKGHNCVLANNDPTAHGEIMAIRDAGKNLKTFDLSGCDLYTTAEPCPMCRGAIFWAKIDHIYYGCTVDDTESIGFNDKDYYAKIATNLKHGEELDRNACQLLFEKYRSIENKILY